MDDKVYLLRAGNDKNDAGSSMLAETTYDGDPCLGTAKSQAASLGAKPMKLKRCKPNSNV